MRRNFVFKLCVSLQCKTMHYFVIRSCNSWVIAVDIKTLMNNDDSTQPVLISIVKYATDGIQDLVHIT